MTSAPIPLTAAAVLLFACATDPPAEPTPTPPVEDSVAENPLCCPDGVWRELHPLDEREEDPTWCTLPGRPLQGALVPPPAIEALMRVDPLFTPEAVVCPTDFSTWLPFMGYTTAALGGDYIFDDNGVVMANMNAFAPGIGYSYAPMSIATYVVRLFGDTVFQGPDDETLAAIRANADWLVENGRETQWEGIDILNWEYPFPGPSVGSPGPWVGGYATSVALPALIGAYCVTNDARYLDTAGRATRGLVLPAILGGNGTWIADDLVWIEEGTDATGLSSRILNGHIAAAAGLWTTWRWTGSELAAAVYEAAVAATAGDLHLHDPGFLTTYMQWAMPGYWPMVAHTSNYNRFQTTELSWLYTATGDPGFLKSALELARYDDPGFTVAVSDTVAGESDYALNRRMVESWTARSGDWTEWTIDPPQELAGFTPWSHVPGEHPHSFVLDVETPEGIQSFERPWPDETCNDTFLPLPNLTASRVRMTVYRDDDQLITMRTAGIHPTRGLPSAVGYYSLHGVANRPIHMFREEGWSYPRLTWVTLDTQDSFEDLTLSWSGWVNETVMPILSGGETLEELAPIVGTPRREGDLLIMELVDVPRYVQVDFPELYYLPDRRMWAEGR